jgi:hypothetical protein
MAILWKVKERAIRAIKDLENRTKSFESLGCGMLSGTGRNASSSNSQGCWTCGVKNLLVDRVVLATGTIGKMRRGGGGRRRAEQSWSRGGAKAEQRRSRLKGWKAERLKGSARLQPSLRQGWCYECTSITSSLVRLKVLLECRRRQRHEIIESRWYGLSHQLRLIFLPVLRVSGYERFHQIFDVLICAIRQWIIRLSCYPCLFSLLWILRPLANPTPSEDSSIFERRKLQGSGRLATGRSLLCSPFVSGRLFLILPWTSQPPVPGTEQCRWGSHSLPPRSITWNHSRLSTFYPYIQCLSDLPSKHANAVRETCR